ncbi:MAG: chitobiase/beta-hexosaminidase C-terminal domain-containing protein [Verrucomicrobiota bacterium]
MKLRACLLALLSAVAVGVVGSSSATITPSPLTLSTTPPYAHVLVSGATPTLYYSAHAGSVTVDVGDTTDSSPLTVDFPSVFGDDPAPGTATSHTYLWTAGGSDTGPKTVFLTDADSPTPDAKSHDFILVRDVAPPTGQSVALAGGPNFVTAFVPLTLTNGTDAGAGVDASSGVVERDSAPLAAGTCGSFSGTWTPITLTTGGDATVATGNCYVYRYTVSDLVGNQSAPSSPSAVARVNTVGPAVALSAPTEGSGASDQFWNATTKTVFFRPTAAGSFTLNATASDTVSSIAQVAFPDVSATTGWTGSTGGVDTSSPYSSPVAYTWTAGAASPGGKQVIATNSTAMTASDTVTISADTAPPAGQAVTLTGGPWFTGSSVPLTVVAGTDGGAGVDEARTVVERASATLTNGACGTFGTFAAVTLSSNADASVASGSCYRYQVKATDNVGNVSIASRPSGDAKVDRTAPTIPQLFFSGFTNTTAAGSVVYFRPGGSGSFTVTAASSDPESGIASYSFPTIPGFTAAGSGPRRTYAFANGGSAPSGPLPVSVTNGAGVSSGTASFSLVGDATPPSLVVRCNGAACSKKPYAKAVNVTLAATDTVSGVAAVRWTSDGSDPTIDHGNQYLRRITVSGSTRLKIRAFDKAGNASPLVSLTVVSRANRLVFGAPSAVVLGAKARYLSLRVTSTRRASVRVTMTGTGLKKPARWSFILDSGTSVVRMRLPKGVKHPGSYRVVWSLRSGTGTTTKSTHLTLRR